jgi:predicted amidophosphoribosyltransferase
MPLSWPRRAARGYNQAEILATAVGRAIGRPARRRLRRVLAFGHQTGRTRRERLAGTARGIRPEDFRPLPFRSLAGRSVLLVDDVSTTGATARAASAALLGLGALRVEVAVAARTPRSGALTGRSSII